MNCRQRHCYTFSIAIAGIRNVVGMQFHPITNTLYFSNNGRDNIGGNVPDDYIAWAPTAGLNYGYPNCHRHVAKAFTVCLINVGSSSTELLCMLRILTSLSAGICWFLCVCSHWVSPAGNSRSKQGCFVLPTSPDQISQIQQPMQWTHVLVPPVVIHAVQLLT